MKKVKIYFHANCLDGAVSAALFTIFLKKQGDNVEFSYHPLAHGPTFGYETLIQNQNIENVVLDLPYPGKNKASWWFDHHQSSFKSSDQRQEYDENKDNLNFYWDSTSPSNASFMVKILTRKFDFRLPENLDNLLKWTDIVDGANFETPDIPTELIETAPAFAALLDFEKNSELTLELIKEIVNEKSLEDLAAEVFWSIKLNNIRQKNWDMIEDVKKLISVKNGVAFIDLSGETFSGYNKFIPYYLEPEIQYAVTLLKFTDKIKFSIGANPWSDFARSPEGADIGSLCERFGGGGHHSIGAISLPIDTPVSKTEEIKNKVLKFLTENVTSQHDKIKKEIIEKAKKAKNPIV